MRLDIYVNYRGVCEEAFRFYEQHLGGKITGIVRHGEQPSPAIPADWKEKVLHGRMQIGTTVLMGADIPDADPMRSAYLTLSLLLLTAYHASAVATLSRSSEQRANLRQQFSRGVAAVLPRTRCCARGRRQAAGM